MEYQNTVAAMEKSEKLLETIDVRVRNVEHLVMQLANAWNRLP
jgi:hypothetical protein